MQAGLKPALSSPGRRVARRLRRSAPVSARARWEQSCRVLAIPLPAGYHPLDANRPSGRRPLPDRARRAPRAGDPAARTARPLRGQRERPDTRPVTLATGFGGGISGVAPRGPHRPGGRSPAPLPWAHRRRMLGRPGAIRAHARQPTGRTATTDCDPVDLLPGPVPRGVLHGGAILGRSVRAGACLRDRGDRCGRGWAPHDDSLRAACPRVRDPRGRQRASRWPLDGASA